MSETGVICWMLEIQQTVDRQTPTRPQLICLIAGGNVSEDRYQDDQIFQRQAGNLECDARYDGCGGLTL